MAISKFISTTPKRLPGGSTVNNNDMKALLPWIDWAYHSVKNNA